MRSSSLALPARAIADELVLIVADGGQQGGQGGYGGQSSGGYGSGAPYGGQQGGQGGYVRLSSSCSVGGKLMSFLCSRVQGAPQSGGYGGQQGGY